MDGVFLVRRVEETVPENPFFELLCLGEPTVAVLAHEHVDVLLCSVKHGPVGLADLFHDGGPGHMVNVHLQEEEERKGGKVNQPSHTHTHTHTHTAILNPATPGISGYQHHNPIGELTCDPSPQALATVINTRLTLHPILPFNSISPRGRLPIL